MPKSPNEISRVKIEIPRDPTGNCELHEKLKRFASDHSLKQWQANEFLLKYGLAAYARDQAKKERSA
jgi:hypothetical protein